LVVNILIVLSGVLMVFTMFAITCSVFARWLFSNTMAWTVDLGAYMLVYITFLAAPWLLQKNGHVSIVILRDALSLQLKRKVKIISSALMLIVLGVLIYFGTLVTIEFYIKGVVLKNILEVPKYLIFIVIPLSALLMFIESLKELINTIKGDYTPECTDTD